VDAVGTLEEYVNTTWGLRSYDFGPAQDNFQFLGKALQDALISSIQNAATAAPVIR